MRERRAWTTSFSSSKRSSAGLNSSARTVTRINPKMWWQFDRVRDSSNSRTSKKAPPSGNPVRISSGEACAGLVVASLHSSVMSDVANPTIPASEYPAERNAWYTEELITLGAFTTEG